MKKQRVLGIDIGGSNVRALIWNGNRVVAKMRFVTPTSAQSLKRMLHYILKCFSYPQRKLAGVGIGAAGVVKNTTVLKSPNIAYLKRFDFRKQFPTSLKLKLDNDARSYARGEYHYGAGKGLKNIFMLTLGTGVGRAVCYEGKVKKIKELEPPERWEKTYQRMQKNSTPEKIATFLATHLPLLLTKYKASHLIIGGGAFVRSRSTIISLLSKKFALQNSSYIVLQGSFGEYAGALGAALLFSQKPPSS